MMSGHTSEHVTGVQNLNDHRRRTRCIPFCVLTLFELIHLDFLTVGKANSEKKVNLLVITDHFTKYVQAFVTCNQLAATVVKTLWERFLVHYGWPSKILTNQGKCFKSQLIKELCNLAQVQKLHTTPYRPETNGTCERFNQTLINMLGTLLVTTKENWP